MKILKLSASLDEIVSKMKNSGYSSELEGLLEKIQKGVDNNIKNINTIVSGLVKETFELEEKKKSLEYDIKLLSDKKDQQVEKDNQLKRQAERVSKQEGDLEEEKKLVEKKKDRLNEWESELKEKHKMIDEKLRGYKIATPKSNV